MHKPTIGCGGSRCVQHQVSFHISFTLYTTEYHSAARIFMYNNVPHRPIVTGEAALIVAVFTHTLHSVVWEDSVTIIYGSMSRGRKQKLDQHMHHSSLNE
ncbi:hypothetical protein NPIL_578021 [Nephila pilipes]|uniref:Uncharacterized protein n=1 Tax=Nephila pilipes TaxID=299642 RepID=A0A8X6TV94_NEPPI|nr:hypothetical protein NPIL_578021 [Nephila pilipes]